MAINGYFFNALYDEQTQTYDREYSAGMMSDYLKGIVGNGVFPNPSTSLQVLADSGLDITVGVGKAWIEGKKLENTAVLNLSLDAADPLLNRIDRIVAVADFTNRLCNIEILKGTAAANPTAPELTRDDSRFELCLAEISITKAATTITQANITDTRANSTICGWVVCLITQVDTSTLYAQWQAAYSEYYAETKTELDAFMETLTQELGVVTFNEEFKATATGDTVSSESLAITLDDYTYTDSDIIDLYINGLHAIEGASKDYTVTGSGATLTFTLASGATYSSLDEFEVRVIKSVIGIEQTINN